MDELKTLRKLAEKLERGMDAPTTATGILSAQEFASAVAMAGPAVILSLLDRLEKAERDAKRYRWLQDNTFGAPPEPTPPEPHVVHTSEAANWREALAADIDAQLDKQEKKQ